MKGPEMKLLVVDDHPALRTGLIALLGQADARTVVLEAADGPQGLRLAGEHPDLAAVFVDLVMPGMHGMTAVQELVRRFPQLPIIVLSTSEDPDDVRRALASGALGYLPKSAPAATIVSALRFVLAGNVYVPPLLLHDMPRAPRVGRAQAHPPAGASVHLTQRQLTVLTLLCGGLSNKEICCRLDLSEKTVKAHVSAIFRAMNVVNRTQAALLARETGLVRAV